MKTYCEFTFEAAHSVPPYSRLHGHTFVAKLTFGGEIDEKFGWPVNLYEVESFISDLKGDHRRPGLDHSNLDENPDITVASLENICMYLWRLFKDRFPGLYEIELKRGFPGSAEGCIYRGERHASAAIGLAA